MLSFKHISMSSGLSLYSLKYRIKNDRLIIARMKKTEEGLATAPALEHVVAVPLKVTIVDVSFTQNVVAFWTIVHLK